MQRQQLCGCVRHGIHGKHGWYSRKSLNFILIRNTRKARLVWPEVTKFHFDKVYTEGTVGLAKSHQMPFGFDTDSTDNTDVVKEAPTRILHPV